MGGYSVCLWDFGADSFVPMVPDEPGIDGYHRSDRGCTRFERSIAGPDP